MFLKRLAKKPDDVIQYLVVHDERAETGFHNVVGIYAELRRNCD
jgi:predicted metal-dependent hydrolase